MRRLRVAWVSPTAPSSVDSPSMGAYFTRQILPRLLHRFDITLFHDNFETWDGFPAFHYLRLIEMHQAKPFDVVFYQVENRALANFVRAAIGILPGVTLFHDFLLSVDGPAPYCSSPWADTIAKVRGTLATWQKRQNDDTRRGPQAFREAGYSPVCIFSDERSKAEYLGNISSAATEEGTASRKHSYYLPYPVTPFSLDEGGSQEIVYCGTPNIEHRAHKMLQAIAGMPNVSLNWLIEERERPQADELLREFDAKNVTLVSGRSPEKWRQMVASARLALHPVFSAFGNGDAYLPISLMAGAPVIAIRYGAIDCLPDEVVCKIDAGYSEISAYKKAISALLALPRDEAGAAGRHFAEEFHNADLVASELAGIFMREANYLRASMQRWESVQADARAELMREVVSLLPQSAGEDESTKKVITTALGSLVGA